MKIRKTRVESYGKMKDRTFELEPGLNVFYGPNEAGKSTLRSFITMTLFPKAGLTYPTQKAGDSGSLEVELEDGSILTFERDGKKSSSTAPQICGIDDKEYVSIYSMQPKELRDVRGIEKGEIRNRFLTIPGGADLPGAYEAIDSQRTALLPDGRRSDRCRIAQLMAAEHAAGRRVKELSNRESGDSQYAELVRKRDRLVRLLADSERKVEAADNVRRASERADAHSGTKQQIADLEALEAKLAYAEGTDTVRVKTLTEDCKRLKETAEEKEGKYDRARIKVRDCPAEAYSTREREIRSLSGSIFEYERRKRQGGQPARTARPEPAGNFPTVLIVGGLVAVAGLAIAALVNLYVGIGAAVGGILVSLMGLRRRQYEAPAQVHTGSDDDMVKYFENRVRELSKELNVPVSDPVNAVNTMMDNLEALKAVAELHEDYEEAKEKADNAGEKLSAFYDGFGGKERYNQAVRDVAKLAEVRAQLEALRKTVENVETVEVDKETADSDYTTATVEKDEVQRELAAVDQALKDISEDTTTEEAITAASDASTEVYNACLDWARLMLEKIILDKATEKAYGEHRPDVLTRADSFLDAMTGGRYRMDTDPRSTSIGIVDAETGEVKTEKEWSSGLEDQVKLSLKMAVSLSLSKEKPPVILDDILLTSDSGRKEGACKALSLLSEDIQVLYFTCDRETRDLMEQAGARVQNVRIPCPDHH